MDYRIVGKTRRIHIDPKPIFEGRFSKVFRGEFHGKEVVVKEIKYEDIFYRIQLRDILTFDDENIVQHFYMDENENGDWDTLYIVLEKCNCTLRKLIADGPLVQPLEILWQLCKGMAYLHERNMAGKDLNPSNILMLQKDGRWIPKISNIKRNRKIEMHRNRSPQAVGERFREYMTPEAWPWQNVEYTLHGDIFSLGIVFYYVLTNGKKPFYCDDRELADTVRHGTVHIELDVLKEDAKSLILAMLAPDFRKRPGIRRILAHHLFWDGRRKLSFIEDVSSHRYRSMLQPLLETQTKEVVGNWRTTLSSEFPILESVIKEMRARSGLCDLLRIISNLVKMDGGYDTLIIIMDGAMAQRWLE